MTSRSKIITVCLATMTFVACGSDQLRQREAALKAKETALRQREQELNDKRANTVQEDYSSAGNSYPSSQTSVKYMYVVISTSEPKIVSERVEDAPVVHDVPVDDPPPAGSFTDGILPREVTPHFSEPPRLPRYIKYAKPQYFTYTSDIIPVTNYNDDVRLMEEDKFERLVQPAIKSANDRIDLDDMMTSGKSVNAVAQIVSRKSFVFDTYAEASNHRAQYKNIK